MRYVWLGFIFLASFCAKAQVPYGNEWLNPAQSYLRLGTTQDGWYRLKATDLQKQGLNLATLPAQSLQLFRRGQEVAILVQGEEDGRLDSTDYVEFYGQRNDGFLDSLLYAAPGLMPHPYYSMYSDTATYFLTWRTDGRAGKRMIRAATSPATNPATYRQEKEFQVLTDEYSAGSIYPLGAGLENGYLQTPGDVGEGWTGTLYRTDQWAVGLGLQTVQPDRIRFARATVKMLFVGRFAGEHRVEIWTGSATKQNRKLGEVQWNHYGTQLFEASLMPEDLDQEGKVNITYVPRSTNDQVSVSYLEWTYPQQVAALPFTEQKKIYPVSDGTIQLDSVGNTRFFDISQNAAPRQLSATGLGIGSVVSPAGSASILAVKTPFPITNIHPVKFRPIDSLSIDFLIITHPLVRQPVADSPDPVADYAAYRASAAGGTFTPLVMNADEVFDQFNYGEPGPVGMKRLIRWLHDRGNLQYTFLIGRSRSPQVVRKLPYARTDDMVPSAGWPDSDLPLSMELDPKNPEVPLVPIGRINAFTSRNVWDYLQKVKQHEAAPAAAPWRKNVLHLSGGRTAQELVLFRSFVDAYATTILPSPVAPAVQTISKKTDEYVERIPIAAQINEGVALMTLFGHSSLNVTDIDIGDASNDILGYRNKGRYPAVLANGCALGNFYFSGRPTSTDWIQTPDRGAILFLAHTHLGFTAALHAYSSYFYEVLADPAFTSRSFGDIMREAINRHMNTAHTLSDFVTAQQMNLQGDPAIKIFPATRPDYAWKPASVFITNALGEKIAAWDDSLRVRAQVANYGRFKPGDYILTIQRKKGTRLLAEYSLTRPAIFLQDSIELMVPNANRQGGDETWEFRLDPQYQIPEEDETNNLFSTTIQIAEGGATALLPADRAVVNKPQVEIIAQAPLYRADARVIFEWNSSPVFGATSQRDTVPARGILARRMLVLSGPTPQTIYWRVRILGDSSQSYRSFTYDPTKGTPSLPEGVAFVVGTYPAQLAEGAPFSARIAFENITEVPFRDSVRVLVREFWGNSVAEKSFLIPPLSPKTTYNFTYQKGTLGRSGVNRVSVQFNSSQVPEEVYTNNAVTLTYTVRPDQSSPVLDVLVDGKRLRDEEVVSPQPTLYIQILNANPYLLHSDTTGLRISVRKICDQCLEVPLALDQARWSPTPTANFRVELTLPPLTAGTYLLTVKARNAKGTEAAPYQIRFRVTEENKVISASASPNPANLWVKFSLELEGKTAPQSWTVDVFDLNGKAVGTLSKKPTLGQNELFWVPTYLPAGLYIYKMNVEGAEWPTSVVGQGKIMYSR